MTERPLLPGDMLVWSGESYSTYFSTMLILSSGGGESVVLAIRYDGTMTMQARMITTDGMWKRV